MGAYVIKFRDHESETRFKEAMDMIDRGTWTIKELIGEMADKFSEKGSFNERYFSRDNDHNGGSSYRDANPGGGMSNRDWDDYREFQEYKNFLERRNRK